MNDLKLNQELYNEVFKYYVIHSLEESTLFTGYENRVFQCSRRCNHSLYDDEFAKFIFIGKEAVLGFFQFFHNIQDVYFGCGDIAFGFHFFPFLEDGFCLENSLFLCFSMNSSTKFVKYLEFLAAFYTKKLSIDRMEDLASYFVECLESNGRTKPLEVTVSWGTEKETRIIQKLNKKLPIHLINCSITVANYLDHEIFEFVRSKQIYIPSSKLSMRIFDGRGAFALSDDELEPEEIHESVKEVHCTRCFRWSYHYEEDYETTNPFPEIKKHFPNADNVFCRIGFHSKVSGDVYGFQKIRNDLLNAPQTFVFIKVFYLYVEPMTKCQLEDYLEKNMIRKKYNFWVEKTDPNKMIELKCIYTQDYEHGFFMFDEHKAAEEALTGLPITTPDKPVWSDKIDCPDDYFTVEETRQLQLTFESW